MKKIKKGEIALYAISLMLVAAGYFNYVTFTPKETKETYSEDVMQIEEEYGDTGDAVLVNNNEVESDNYFINSKLDREKMYAEMLSNYEKILNNNNLTETQKTIATQEITKINNTKNAIMVSENLIKNKGFQENVIFANEKSVNIVVKKEDELTKEDIAKIQNIISRELKTEIVNIHITRKND